MERKIIATEETKEDRSLEPKIRPQLLSDYIGQSRLKELLRVYIEAARLRHAPLDHCLFYGPPGLGKTTISNIIANELQVNLKISSGPAIEKPGEMAAILNSLSEGDVLFVDEIHRLNRQVEEVLYPAMEDFAIDIMLGKDASARSLRLELPRFTLVGATTRAGLLSAPLRDRFGIVQKLEFYTTEELREIVIRSASVLEVPIDDEGAAMDILDVDRLGLDQNDRNYLLTIIEKFIGGPVGLDTLASALGEDSGTLEDVYEPYLLMNGLINRTPKGRIATRRAYQHLGLPFQATMDEM